MLSWLYDHWRMSRIIKARLALDAKLQKLLVENSTGWRAVDRFDVFPED